MPQERQKHKDAVLSGWLDRCDPAMPVEPENTALYFDLDAPGLRLRGNFQLADLLRPVRLEGPSSCQLFSGFSGKSTELRQLRVQLEEQGYVVLLADARSYLTLSQPLEIVDLLVVLAGAFGDETHRIAPVQGKIFRSYWETLLELLTSKLELGEAAVKVGPLDLQLNVKHGNEFWRSARERLAQTPLELETHVHSYIRQCIARLRQHAKSQKKGVVFIVDSLEHLRGSLEDFEQLMSSAVRVFVDHARELHLPDCHVIYTVPPYLGLLAPEVSSHYDTISEILPAIKIEKILGRNPLELVPFRDGIEALSALVGKRIPLDVIFGPRRENLETLVHFSGGHVRTLISMIKSLIFRIDEVGTPVDEEDIEEVVRPFRARARQGIWQDHLLLLDRIMQNASVEDIRKEELPVVADFMDRHAVLCYANGDGWYGVHPLVRDTVQERVNRLRAEPPKPAGFRS